MTWTSLTPLIPICPLPHLCFYAVTVIVRIILFDVWPRRCIISHFPHFWIVIGLETTFYILYFYRPLPRAEWNWTLPGLNLWKICCGLIHWSQLKADVSEQSCSQYFAAAVSPCRSWPGVCWGACCTGSGLLGCERCLFASLKIGDGPRSQASQEDPPGVDGPVNLTVKQFKILPGFSFSVEITEVLSYDPGRRGLMPKQQEKK